MFSILKFLEPFCEPSRLTFDISGFHYFCKVSKYVIILPGFGRRVGRKTEEEEEIKRWKEEKGEDVTLPTYEWLKKNTRRILEYFFNIFKVLYFISKAITHPLCFHNDYLFLESSLSSPG